MIERHIRSYSPRSERMTERLERVWNEYSPRFVLDTGQTLTPPEGLELDLELIYGRRAPLIIEVGSGTGTQIAAAAKANPGNDYLGFEVWKPGIARTLAAIKREGLTNVRLVCADAYASLPRLLGPYRAAEVWTFFPDPWQKARHNKRRLVTDAFAQRVWETLDTGGVWRLATDWEEYAQQMLDVVAKHEGFTNPTGGPAPRWEGRIETRFESRGHRAGREITDVCALKNSDSER